MSTFEAYRLGIPLFTPSVEFILSLGLLKERVYWKGTPHSAFGASAAGEASPNAAGGPGVAKWVALSDTYTMPFITTFDSYDDLIAKLDAADLGAIAANMRRHSATLRGTLHAKWSAIIARAVAGGTRAIPSAMTYAEAMRALYPGGTWPNFASRVDCQRVSAPDQGRWN
jgi:hypothetical protein